MEENLTIKTIEQRQRDNDYVLKNFRIDTAVAGINNKNMVTIQYLYFN